MGCPGLVPEGMHRGEAAADGSCGTQSLVPPNSPWVP